MSLSNLLLSESVVIASINQGGIQTVKPETIQKYRMAIKSLVNVIGDIDCALVTAPMVLEWQRTTTFILSPVSSNNYLNIYRGIFNRLTKRGIVQTNPFTYVPLLDTPSLDPKNVKKEHFEILVKRSPIKFKAILWLLWDTGARPSEICDIKKEKIEITEDAMGLQFAAPVIGKFNKERWIFARHEAAKAVLNYIDIRTPSDSPYLFLGRTTKPMKRPAIYQGIVSIKTKKCPEIPADVKITPQMFRPTWAYRMWVEGKSIAWISKALGHVDLAFTVNRYFRPTKQQMKDAYFNETSPRMGVEFNTNAHW